MVVPYCPEASPHLPADALRRCHPSPCGIASQEALLPPRLRRRLDLLFDSLAEHPGCSLPQALGCWAATKAAYRFFAHPLTSVANLLPALVLPAVNRALSFLPSG